jgi:methyl-accepting chemotaxis protein
MDRNFVPPVITGISGAIATIVAGLAMQAPVAYIILAACAIVLAALAGVTSLRSAQKHSAKEVAELISQGASAKATPGGAAATMLPLITSFDAFRKNLSARVTDLALTSEILEATFDYFVGVTSTQLQDIETIRARMEEQRAAVQNTSSSVVELLSSIDSIANSADNQSVSVEQLSSTIEEMSANVKSIADVARKAAEITKDLLVKAEEGGRAVESTVDQIKKVKGLSEQITEMNAVISDIAGRTNLLAMNAAIEAAHAGDAGRGFAVVADEIRKLAESSSQSAKQIEHLVRNVVSAINDSSSTGTVATEQYSAIMEDVRSTRKIVDEVTSAMAEQSHGVNEILEATTSLVNITEQIQTALKEQKAANQDISSAIGNLEKTATDVQTITGRINDGKYRMMDAVNRLGKVSVRNFSLTVELRSKG